ncbi:MAG: energy-coupling factor ABC transporter permease [Firmicutes bacterium]|nr:energy-coupling factor ABC transporter permease [Bacillota bacterium]
MHIPDGFLDVKTWVATGALSAGTLAYALRRTRRTLQDRQVPAMGVMAAFIFAAQMVNFPIVGGTSGHLIGAVLAAVTLGPWSACVIMTVILILQALLFQDGGLTALGANILNMGVVAVFAGYGVYRLLRRYRTVGVFVASWVSVMLAAAACAAELAVAGTIPLAVVLPAMLFWHAFIGVGEGLITAAVVEILARTGVAPSRDTAKA